jgi:predicted RNA binding protein YcfA (HicA-like mRNA interferase family)
MPKLIPQSGDHLIKILVTFGFSVKSQKGSHIKLYRVTMNQTQILTIPRHKELGKGTLLALYKQAVCFIPESELRHHFYSE